MRPFKVKFNFVIVKITKKTKLLQTFYIEKHG